MANGPGKHYRKGLSLIEITQMFPDNAKAEKCSLKTAGRTGGYTGAPGRARSCPNRSPKAPQRVGAGARGGGHGGLLHAWCDDDQPLLMRCQGFFRGEVWRSFRAPERGQEGGVMPVLEGGGKTGA